MAANCRYFKVADIAIKVEFDVSLLNAVFSPNVAAFEIARPENDTVHIKHHFGLPDHQEADFGQMIYSREDLTIYRDEDRLTFLCSIFDHKSNPLKQVVYARNNYRDLEVFSSSSDLFTDSEIGMLSFYQTDQLFITRILADLQGCMLHSSAVVLDGKGFMFVGHSEAGKSTMIKMLTGKAKILCDDRNIIRKTTQGFRVYGTWHHGEIPTVSPDSAPL